MWAKPTAKNAESKPEPEEPLKVDDHGMDTMRYVVEPDLVGTSHVQSPARRGQTGGQVSRGAQRYGRSIGNGGGGGRGRR
ncbi:hypothetical protein [Streptomyces nigra]|uniref:hypothetical protein n=1 Tax=Streptomyces nigra TaxID=1827580 RepID=UPI0034347E0F